MKAIWSESPMSAREIAAKIESTKWSFTTIRTLINRLEKKGVLGRERLGREFLYHPRYQKEDYIKKESNTLLKRLFDGATAPLISHFIKDQKMTPEDREAICRLIDDLKEDS